MGGVFLVDHSCLFFFFSFLWVNQLVAKPDIFSNHLQNETQVGEGG